MAQVLGRYHIISELGRGGMGVVYKALDPKLERFIAIKCLSEELSADEIVVARFLREARNVAALNHPNIAQIFVADEHEGKPYFVMEYVDGESLADFIDREGQCSPEMARRVTEQAANALSAAAEEGIVHRDVKPGNIMIDRRGRAVLTDFGIACVTAEQSESGSQSIMGTPGYLPPEALSGGPVDSRSDMFALGAVWYEMLTGQRLMPGRDLKETFTQLAAGDFPDLSAVEGKVDERVVEILRTLLAVQPGDRYADWSGLLTDMEPLKTGRTGPVERPDSGPSTAEREVTAALATERTARQTAAATASAPEATAVLQTETESRHPVPAQQEAAPRRRSFAAVAIVLVLVLALAAAGLGLAYVAPSTWNKMTAWLPGGEEQPAAAASAATESETALADAATADTDADGAAASGQDEQASATDAKELARAGLAVADGDSGEQAPIDEGGGSEAGLKSESGESQSAVGGSPTEESAPGESPAVADGAAASSSVPEQAGPGNQAADASTPASAESDDRSLAMADSDAAEVAAVPESDAPSRPAAPPPPRGIVVLGVGDPVIADPMVREIESALRGGSHPLVQPNFISGYRDHVQGEELDLAGLADPALDAGARYVVVARALPAGERELQYYNRVETAFIAQLEAVTYDLHAMQKMGSSPVEQIEFTSLNATRRAVDSVRPWLAGIRDQFD
ncbi:MULTISPECIES: serine/threonine-protein kinase [unclassified Wenzhouxiangella]|uniref:serine/threonine-protein kinase n=1 Tax=unclassified Wenzhouxiangella TaxID=2613841 RepID=UPI000E32963E|nr:MULTISPECIES: serine/threonine-protein kinase [unclassified Wenzhouxiangella]RFF26923.1 serine/threonine protein kinase [Wenzhouxiangella sp. 15181]RFP68004.1 serine/threonine protein kinase [Wenzhouxiangella sp. 15190]